MNFMSSFVQSSSKEMQVGDEISVIPFKLDYQTEIAPSHFEVCFLQNNVRFRYGFEVDKKTVVKEWLLSAVKQQEKALFVRENGNIAVNNDFAEGKDLEEKTRDNALFLSVVAQFNGQTAGNIVKWFKGFKILYGLKDQSYENYTAQLLQHDATRRLLTELIRQADIGIEDLVADNAPGNVNTIAVKLAGQQSPTYNSKQYRISSVHRKFKDGVKASLVNLDFANEESEGTKKFFRITGPMLDCLANGYVVCIDELDAKLHPLLTKAIVHIFNSPRPNPKNAQLIFTTHDTNLLQFGNLRRGQIWFTEKNQQSATDLYSLAEFKLPDGSKIRNDENYEPNYIKGKYGAIPFLGDMEKLLKEVGDGAPRQVD